jgi:C-terminal processing protease CtpA/Prc
MTKVFRLSLLTALVFAMGIGLASAKTTSRQPGAWLGVYTQSVDDEMAEGFKLPVKSGAIINEVVDESPADEAGLRDNDIVVSIDGSKIETADDLTTYVQDHAAGDIITIKVLRDGKEQELKVTLGKRPRQERRIEREYAFGVPGHPDVPDAPDAPKGAKTQVFKFFSDESTGSYIGVELTSLSDQLRAYFGVTGDGGVLVSSVEKETPAEKAGLKAGDVIIKADGDEVTDANDVREVVADKDKGAKVELTLVRDRKEMTVAVEVAENEHAEHGRKSMRTFTMPDMGHMQAPNMPRMKGLWYGTEDRDKNSDDLRDELKDLRSQLEDLRKQLDELRQSRK